MKKLIYLILLFALPLSFTSCGDDDDPVFVWGGDWNDPKDPNYKPAGYNPLKGLWKYGADTTGLLFTEDFKIYNVRFFSKENKTFIKTLRDENYVINGEAYRTSVNNVYRYKIDEAKDMLMLYPDVNDDRNSLVLVRMDEDDWTDIEHVNSFETSGFVFVNYTPELGWYGVSPGIGYISFPNLKLYNPGDVIFASYKGYTNKVDSKGIFQVEKVVVDDNLSFLNSEQRSVDFRNPVPEGTLDNSLINWVMEISVPTNQFGNRWLFSYRAQRAGEQTMDVDFYYDPDRQEYPNATNGTIEKLETLENGGDLVVIDVKLRKGSTSVTDKKEVSGSTMADFTTLRSFIKAKLPETTKLCYIAFRYNQLSSDRLTYPEKYTVRKGYGMDWTNE